MKKKIPLILLIMLIATLVAGCGGKEDGVAPDPAMLIESRCTRCHTLDVVYVARDIDEWPGIVELMIQKSPNLLNESETDTVVNYLQEHYGQ